MPAHVFSSRRALSQSSRSRQMRLGTATNVVVFGSRPSGSLLRLRRSDWAFSRGSLLVPSSQPEVPSGTWASVTSDRTIPSPARKERALARPHRDLTDRRGGQDEPTDQDRERGL